MASNKAWSESELELLEILVNIYPPEMITGKINKFNRKHKTGVTRTKNAVEVKINRIGYSQLATEDNMSAREWARSLGVNSYRVQGWIRKQGLQAIKGCNYWIISKNNMIEFANKRPELLAVVSKDILLYYFGESLTHFILSKNKMSPPMSVRYKIKRTDTGLIYSSLTKAAKDLGMNRHSVRNEAKRNGWLKFV
jgi:hypothetical protein